MEESYPFAQAGEGKKGQPGPKRSQRRGPWRRSPWRPSTGGPTRAPPRCPGGRKPHSPAASRSASRFLLAWSIASANAARSSSSTITFSTTLASQGETRLRRVASRSGG